MDDFLLGDVDMLDALGSPPLLLELSNIRLFPSSSLDLELDTTQIPPEGFYSWRSLQRILDCHDVLRLILGFCDWKDWMALRATCRDFHQIVEKKTIIRILVGDKYGYLATALPYELQEKKNINLYVEMERCSQYFVKFIWAQRKTKMILERQIRNQNPEEWLYTLLVDAYTKGFLRRYSNTIRRLVTKYKFWLSVAHFEHRVHWAMRDIFWVLTLYAIQIAFLPRQVYEREKQRFEDLEEHWNLAEIREELELFGNDLCAFMCSLNKKIDTPQFHWVCHKGKNNSAHINCFSHYYLHHAFLATGALDMPNLYYIRDVFHSPFAFQKTCFIQH